MVNPSRPLHPILRFISSYGLGLVVLILMMVLLVLGTLWQAEYGLLRAQQMFYHSYFLSYPVGDTWLRIPLPGARLLMVILFINLLAATLLRMKPRRQIIGVYIVHGGILVLLGGGFLTAYGSYEGYMRIEEGKASNFSERFTEEELAIVRHGEGNEKHVTAIYNLDHQPPGTRLIEASDEIPFSIEVVQMMPNNDLYVDEAGSFARRYGITETASKGMMIGPASRATAESKLLAGVFRLIPREGEPRVFILSDRLVDPLHFHFEGTHFDISVRDRRDYYPFSIYLREFRHEVHPGTRMAASYESDVTLVHPEAGIDGRQLRIYMNNPLRYQNLTFYQASFEGDSVTIFQVVKNDGLAFPYIATIIISLGLIWQFVQVLLARAKVQRRLLEQMAEG